MAVVAAVAACSDSLGGPGGRDNASAPSPKVGAEQDGGAPQNSDGKAGPATAGAPISNGVLIVHAAIFPSIRLCFENDLDRVPEPNSAVMPEANVVGVEQGSIVRIDPLTKAPGRIIVVREKDWRGHDERKCSEIFSVGADGTITGQDLDVGTAFRVTEPVAQPVGVSQAELLVIHGCGVQNTLDTLDQVAAGEASSERCGAGWTAAKGNIGAKTMPLQASFATPTDKLIPAQLINAAPAIEALKGSATVTFGESGKPGRNLGLGPTFQAGAQLELDVNQTVLASYATLGFDVAVKVGTDTVTATQTLADVQSLSAPSETPSHYYRSASNYALLLLGDPTHKPTLDGGGDNPAYNPRRALHILAVPVLDPTKQDAGAPDASTDSGT
jgi:hypothetical protein